MILRNPQLDMTTQIGWVCIRPDVVPEFVCNWCMHQLHHTTKNFAAITEYTFLPPLKCKCGNELVEGPAVFSDQRPVDTGEPMGTKKKEGSTDVTPPPIAHVNGAGTLMIHHQCFLDHQEYKNIIKKWEEVRDGAILAEDVASMTCMVCQKGIEP